ncbi:unnamed protein product [Ixodes persulcatus]
MHIHNTKCKQAVSARHNSWDGNSASYKIHNLVEYKQPNTMKINVSEDTFANLPPLISLQYRTQTKYAACISEFQRKSQTQ